MSEGLRYDAGKPPVDLLSAPALTEVAKVLKFGATKYAPHNWRKGMAYSKVIGPMLRHVLAIMAGEDRDPESGELHAAHVMCNAMFLTEYQLEGIGTDDRFKSAGPAAGQTLPTMPSLEQRVEKLPPAPPLSQLVNEAIKFKNLQVIPGGKQTVPPTIPLQQEYEPRTPRHASDRVVPETDLDKELNRLLELERELGCPNPDCFYCSSRTARIKELQRLKGQLP